jgi:hypothetical protein
MSSQSPEYQNFLQALPHYDPTVPSECIEYLAARAGSHVSAESSVSKLIAIAADKFLADTLHEARQYSKIRAKAVEESGKNAGKKVSEKKAQDIVNVDSLSMEDLSRSLGNQRIYIQR